MADTKLSALTELAAAPDLLDEFVLVDKSDTTMAASGTTKRIKRTNLFADHGVQARSVLADGAVLDGTTDDRAAVNTTIDTVNAAGGGIVFVPEGTLNVASSPGLVFKENVIVVGAGPGATLIKQSYTPGSFLPFIDASGTVSDSDLTTLTANASPGDVTLTVTSTAGITAGQRLQLGSETPFLAAAASSSSDELRYKGEIVRVKSVDSGTGLTLYGFVRDSYTTANTASLRTITFIRNVGIRDLQIYNPSPGTHTSDMLRFRAVDGFVVENVEFRGGDNVGLSIDTSVNGTVKGCRWYDFTDDTANSRFGYGINLVRSAEEIAVTGCTFDRLRHAVTTNGINNKRGVPRNVVVADCVATRMTNSAFDTHVQGAGIVFDGCQAVNCDHVGYQIRSADTKLLGCSASYCIDGVVVGLEAEGVEIRGGTFRKIVRVGGVGGYGIEVQGSDRTQIVGVTVDGVDRNCVFVGDGTNDLLVADCVLLNPGQDAANQNVISVDAAATIARLRAVNNKGGDMATALDEGRTTGNANNGVSLPAGASDCLVVGNRWWGLAGAAVSDAGTNNLSWDNVEVDARPVGLEAYSNADQQNLVSMRTDRPWHFRQRSSGATARLELWPEFDGKDFDIVNNDGEIVARYHCGTSTLDDNYIEFAEGRIRVNDSGHFVLDSTNGNKIGTATTQKLGFWNATPVVQPAAYTVSNVTTDRTYNANSYTMDELADVLGTLIGDLQSIGLIG